MLPMTKAEMESRGWRQIDILLVTGDAYFDHPSHGAALLGRVLENAGYRVGIISQPDWRSVDDFKRLGTPNLFAGVTAGAVDSSINNYTANMAKRKKDVYSPGGRAGRRPDYASLVYANRRQTYWFMAMESIKYLKSLITWPKEKNPSTLLAPPL